MRKNEEGKKRICQERYSVYCIVLMFNKNVDKRGNRIPTYFVCYLFGVYVYGCIIEMEDGLDTGYKGIGCTELCSI